MTFPTTPDYDSDSSSTAALEESLQLWQAWLFPGNLFNLPALMISLFCTVLLLMGVKESKTVANFFTSLKMILVAFMIVGGFGLYQSSNFITKPFAPFGVSGVLRGATSSFFGYLGYDEVCVVAGEALSPQRNVPRAILATLLIVTVCYILASIALVGMQYYPDISPTAGFPAAFEASNLHWAAQLSATGELITLPVVVLISLLAQPRLTYSMALDGVLPPIFARQSADGNLIGGTLVWGIVMIATAATIPFTYLDDLISCGILVAFCLANSCLILLRAQGDYGAGNEAAVSTQQLPSSRTSSHPYRLHRSLMAYNVLCCFSALLWSHVMSESSAGNSSSTALVSVLATVMTVAMVACYTWISLQLQKAITSTSSTSRKTNGQKASRSRDMYDVVHSHDDDLDNNILVERHDYFQTPLVPFVPCVGMAINWYLIAQLEMLGLVLLVLYLGGTVIIYRTFRRRPRRNPEDGHSDGIMNTNNAVASTTGAPLPPLQPYSDHGPSSNSSDLRPLPIPLAENHPTGASATTLPALIPPRQQQSVANAASASIS
eukprot:CAMPEP_0172442600 /NCGR_PEP_ID=MMETSP1065-20121228/3003_1 /TAXON_ID=265537 /ORGANISM="Amphiprora paludosa, Strain CCMP125" /LENGTH=548 /DNA_ID=CAMNT_0013192529 /DNA_START=29 /DNA_END=1675 /DNA_ORIENTATION=-